MAQNRARRRATALLAAAGILLAPVAQAVTRCASDVDQVVFEVEALKTELMVVATTCKGNTEDRYNAFVERYKPALVQSNRMLGQYFGRLHGRGGQKQNDIYITELANARSNAARQLGSDFCPRNAGLFDEVMALPGLTELPAYAATKDLLSAGVFACAGASTATASSAPRRTGSAR